MKTRLFPILICVLSILFLSRSGSAAPETTPMGNTFTYQGKLVREGTPYTGNCNFQFSLWDATGLVQYGDVNTFDGLAVTEGEFTATELYFGPSGFIGSARWLEVVVQCPGDAGPTTFPRQELTAAPYALFAAAAPWSGLTGMPAGFADGRDNDIIPALFRITTLDSDGLVGNCTSITIGVDGLGLVSYYDITNGDLKVAHCTDIACSSAITATLDSTGDVGSTTSITIGADGLGLISYYDYSNHALKVAHCNDIACSSAGLFTLDSPGNAGAYSSITVGVDGLGLISYSDAGYGHLKVAHCNDTACSSATNVTLDSTALVGDYTSITINPYGLGLISYYDYSNGDLKLARCNDTACTSATLFTLDSTGDVGIAPSISIGADGFGLISYFDDTHDSLKVAHCSDLNCTSATTITGNTIGSAGRMSSITIGSDGLGVISFNNDSNSDLSVIHCGNTDCSEMTSATTVDPNYLVGYSNSITIGADRLPLISYFDGHNGDLKVVHCSNSLCIPWYRR